VKPIPRPSEGDEPLPHDGVSLGIMPIPNGVHLQIHESGSNHVIDFVLSADNAMALAVTLMHAVQIARDADPPTFN